MAVVGVPTGSVVIYLMPTAWATTVCAAQAFFHSCRSKFCICVNQEAAGQKTHDYTQQEERR